MTISRRHLLKLAGAGLASSMLASALRPVTALAQGTNLAVPTEAGTYPFQVLSRNGVPEPFGAWKDVVNLPEHDIVRIAVPVETFTGRTVFHCHVVEHEDRGMMGTFEVT